MAQDPREVVIALEQNGLFKFSPPALSEINWFTDSSNAPDPDRLRDHLALSSAEFALIPSIAKGAVELPVRVSVSSARVATAKTNCTLFDGCSQDQPDPQLSRITVFSADAARISRVARTEGHKGHKDMLSSNGQSILSDITAALKTLHQNSSIDHIKSLATPGGVLDLQSLLWQLHANIEAGADAQDPAPIIRAFSQRHGQAPAEAPHPVHDPI